MLILYFVNREYMMNFFRADRQPCGAIMLIIAGLMIVSGFLIVRKLVDIDI
jgi:Flp pilus assembly protein TadB